MRWQTMPDKPKMDLTKNPEIELSNPPEAIFKLRQRRKKASKGYREANRRPISCLSLAVNVLHAFAWIVDEVVSSSYCKELDHYFVMTIMVEVLSILLLLHRDSNKAMVSILTLWLI
jgi:hypothetical protein